MSTAWLGLGSNVDADTNIRVGIRALEETFRNVRLSPAYISAAVGFEGDDFINLVARVDTDMHPIALRQYLRELEDHHGRKRNVPKFSDRFLDVDILLYDDLVVLSPVLEVPRAEILKFAHVLKPLADLDPELVHPSDRRTMSEIWESSGLDGGCLRLLPSFN
ncbi:MAG: 2-amino-4-hydroxy-6-hydroxymethyldihydropteridine diphosphokinase [Gammaproteobacteria bacterium]|nr:2-amino-4-hydroxy-6-hydroxymethyldihydropteridine diphosphokinase [Gammaproteobacteria bacterium]